MKYTSNDMQIILIHPVVSAGQGGLRSWITLYIEIRYTRSSMRNYFKNGSKDHFKFIFLNVFKF